MKTSEALSCECYLVFVSNFPEYFSAIFDVIREIKVLNLKFQKNVTTHLASTDKF